MNKEILFETQLKELTSSQSELVQANLPLVFLLAHRLVAPPLTFPERVGAGFTGLIKSIVNDEWDPERGTFSTYAKGWIKEAVYRAQAESLGLPRHAVMRVRKYRETVKRLMMEVGTTKIPAQEVLDAMGLKRQDARQNTLNALRLVCPLELDVDDDGEFLPRQTIPTAKISVSEQVEAQLLKEMLEEILFNDDTSLTAREEIVLSWRYGLNGHYPVSRPELAAKMGITSERVRQIENAAYVKLRPHPIIRSLFETSCGLEIT